MASRSVSTKSSAKKRTSKRAIKPKSGQWRNGASAPSAPKLSGTCRTLQEIGLMMLAGRKDPTLLDRIADLVQRTCKYRWVGVYKVMRGDFVLAGSSDSKKPAYPEFPITQGVSAEAYEKRKTVIIKDVSKDKRFLPNFWTTKSEIVAPIVDDEHDVVSGVINVESSKLNAFDKTDRDFLEGVGRLIWRALR